MVEEPFGWRAAIDLECDEDAARSQAKRDSGCGAGGGEVGIRDWLLHQVPPDELMADHATPAGDRQRMGESGRPPTERGWTRYFIPVKRA